MSDALVRVRDLHKSFTRGTEPIHVLRDLTLDVGLAEFLALMGPSGSGKTTLLNLIAGLDQPTGGVITVGENVISEMSESELARWRTRHVGFPVIGSWTTNSSSPTPSTSHRPAGETSNAPKKPLPLFTSPFAIGRRRSVS